MSSLYIPTPITQVSILYWESILRRGWANSFTYDLLEFFEYGLPNGIRIRQKLSFETYNSNRDIEYDNSTRQFIERFMRPYKLQGYPLVLLNMARPGISIDSYYTFNLFKEEFGEALDEQVYGKREVKEEPVPQPAADVGADSEQDTDATGTPPKKKKSWF